MKKCCTLARGDTRRTTRAFTLLEVALIVAIIGMMMLILVGYLFAPKEKGALPPVAAPTPIPSSTAPATPSPKAAVTPAPAAITTPTLVPAAPATDAPPPAPAPAPAQTQTIDLSPQSAPVFR